MIPGPGVAPDFTAVTGAAGLSQVVGALLTIGLIAAVAMLIVSAVIWAICSHTGSWQTATRARGGVLVALGGAALTGGALTWTNWLLDTGATL